MVYSHTVFNTCRSEFAFMLPDLDQTRANTSISLLIFLDPDWIWIKGKLTPKYMKKTNIIL